MAVVHKVLVLLVAVQLSAASSIPSDWTGTSKQPDSEEFPAEFIDPAAIDLTSLVNTLINSSHSGSRQLFSLLSVASYSPAALHKLTLLVYNISSFRSSDVFRRRFCYCVSNDTNDLTDFTAILLDVMSNSSSHLHELFKSASILSVNQRNNSECIYICVMAGRTALQQQLWHVGSVSPLYNVTVMESRPAGLNVSHMTWSGSSRVHSTVPVSSTAQEEAGPTPRTQAGTPGGQTVQTVEARLPLSDLRPALTDLPHRPGHQDPPAATPTHRNPATLRETQQNPATPGDTHLNLATPGETHQNTTTLGDTYQNLATPGETHQDPAKPGDTHLNLATLGETHQDPATSGDTHLNLATPGETHQDQATPGDTHLNLATPGETHQDQTTPGDTHLNLATPGETHQDQATPGDTHQDQTTPGDTHLNLATPGETHQDQATPGDTHQDQATPGDTHLNQAIPGETHLNPATPGETPQDQATPGDTHLNLATPGETHQDQTTPGDTHLNPATPGETHQDQATPGDTHLNPATPGETHQDQTTPGDTHLNPATPGETHQDQTTPGDTHLNLATPGETHQDPATSGDTDQTPATLGDTHQNLETSGETHQNRATPGDTHQNPTTPGDTNKNLEKSGETHQNPTIFGETHQNPTTPGDTHQNPTTPGDTHQNPTTPGDTHQNPTTPGDTHQNPTTPGHTYQNPATPGHNNWTSVVLPTSSSAPESTVKPGTVPPEVGPYNQTPLQDSRSATPRVVLVQTTAPSHPGPTNYLVLPRGSTQMDQTGLSGPGLVLLSATVNEPGPQSLGTGRPDMKSPHTEAREPAVGLKTTERSTSTPAHIRPSPTNASLEPTSEAPDTPVEAGCLWKRAELSRAQVDVSTNNLQPCVLELCRFFSQCLCRRSEVKAAKSSFCDDSNFWYEKHTLEVCRRVRRVSVSRNLRQRCLLKMCDKL